MFFVVVGANDGKSSDPFAKILAKDTRWRGIFIEPVPYVFERLRKNYPDESRYICENLAITDGSSTLPFYYVAAEAAQKFPGELPKYFDQVGSFDRNHIVIGLGQAIEPFIVTANVRSESFESVMARNQVGEIDFLQIDTEGFDFEVLKLVDLQKHRVGVILFEHMHLSATDQAAADRLLRDNQYDFYRYQGDTLAVRKVASQ